jgi:hypothetical protein
MSIRLIARELYRLQKEVERLEQELAQAPQERKERIADRLRIVRAENKRMRDVLDGQKDSGK